MPGKHPRPRDLRGALQAVLRLLLAAAFLAAALPFDRGLAASPAQEDAETRRARDLLARMTPEERVGQLFLITFTGAEITPGSEIYDLIFNRYVGGVILLDKNGNFPPADDPLEAVRSLTTQLQATRFAASQEPRTNPTAATSSAPPSCRCSSGFRRRGTATPPIRSSVP